LSVIIPPILDTYPSFGDGPFENAEPRGAYSTPTSTRNVLSEYVTVGIKLSAEISCGGSANP
jgi:hypothetical protein